MSNLTGGQVLSVECEVFAHIFTFPVTLYLPVCQPPRKNTYFLLQKCPRLGVGSELKLPGSGPGSTLEKKTDPDQTLKKHRGQL